LAGAHLGGISKSYPPLRLFRDWGPLGLRASQPLRWASCPDTWEQTRLARKARATSRRSATINQQHREGGAGRWHGTSPRRATPESKLRAARRHTRGAAAPIEVDAGRRGCRAACQEGHRTTTARPHAPRTSQQTGTQRLGEKGQNGTHQRRRQKQSQARRRESVHGGGRTGAEGSTHRETHGTTQPPTA